MSDLKIVCLARRGKGDVQPATVEVLPADECLVRYAGKNRMVFWSRPGRYLAPEAERKTKEKGGERFMNSVSYVDDPFFVLPVEEAVEQAEKIRNQLWDAGELADIESAGSV